MNIDCFVEEVADLVKEAERSGKEKARQQILLFLKDFAELSLEHSRVAERYRDTFAAQLSWASYSALTHASERIEELKID